MKKYLCQLTERELATVLAALRLFQAQKQVPGDLAGPFAEHAPLSNEEIKTLCEQLN